MSVADPSRIAIVACCMALASVLLILPISPRAIRKAPASYAALFGAFESQDRALSSVPSSPVLPPDIAAAAAMVYDPLHNAVVFQKNSEKQFGIASLTKIMTAFVAESRVEEGEIISVSIDAVRTEGAEGNLIVGERLTLRNLITIMMTSSSNDAAVAVAEHVGRLQGATTFNESQEIFVRLMNEHARALDLHHTEFWNATGLDLNKDGGGISNVSTARDLALLISYTLRHSSLWDTHKTSSTLYSQENIPHVLVTTHELMVSNPGIINGKTGFTDAAGGVLVTIAEAPVGNLSIIIILESTWDSRFSDTKALLEWLRST